MKNAVFLFCVASIGCATTPVQPSGAMLDNKHQIYCDLSYPEIGLIMYSDVENGVLVRERVDVDGDQIIDRVVEYRPIDDALTEVWTDEKKVAEIRRTETQIVSDWEEPPRRDVMILDETGRIVRIETDDTSSGVEGKDGETDSIRTLIYEGDKIVRETSKRGDLVEVTENHEYAADGRRSKTTRVVSGLFAETQEITLSYADGRCLSTVN